MLDKSQFRKADAYTMKNNKSTRKVDTLKSIELLIHIDENVNAMTAFANECLEAGWRIVAADTVRGVCYYDRMTITIPLWIMKQDAEKSNGILHYYLAHELAHAKAGYKNHHNQVFMEAFKMLCHKEYWHHEFDYKTASAMKAGILPEDF